MHNNKNTLLTRTILFIQFILFFGTAMPNAINNHEVQAIILAAGQGSRLKTGITKLITPICGQPMVLYTVALMQKLSIPTTIVIGYQKELVQQAIESANIPNLLFAKQAEQLGTGHALLCSKETWHANNILVMNGDMPLITPDIITQLCLEHQKNNAAISIVTSYNVDPANAFGRIVQQGDSIKIVEKKHFTFSITDYPYVNAGIYLINRAFLETFLSTIKQNEKTNEFYITDLVEIASNHQLPVITMPFPFELLNGVNTFEELATVEQIKRNELIHYWMANGIRFTAPHTVHLDLNATIGRGTVINAGVQLLNNTKIGEFCTIHPHAVLDNATLENKVIVGAQSVIENVIIKEGTTLPAFSYGARNKFMHYQTPAHYSQKNDVTL
ncbi:MAG: NTP transferase domain-containing protein [Candidatus Dependentiae bacterium]|nr:NTP transferase domain-containing protein [Candidatus Dependentiae bacterium]